MRMFANGVIGYGWHWSSSEFDLNMAWAVNGMTALDTDPWNKALGISVRACRTFTGEVGEYAIGDTGPAGGMIFHISGTTYYEAAPSDQSTSKTWSNINNVAIGTTSIVIGEGQNNTNEIIAQAGHTDSAAKLCNDLVI